MKYRIRTYSIRIFFVDISWLSGHLLKILSEKLEYSGDKIAKLTSKDE